MALEKNMARYKHISILGHPYKIRLDGSFPASIYLLPRVLGA